MSRKDISDLDVCRAYRDSAASKWALYPYELLKHWTGEPFKVCYQAMERADDRRLVEYGVSLRMGWLTEKGLEMLKREER